MGYKNRPVKILFVSHISGMAGGAQRSLLLLLKNINRRHFEPIVALPGSGPLREEIDNLNIKTYEIKSPWWVSVINWTTRHFMRSIIQEIIALFGLYKIVKQEKIDVVYTNTIVNFSGAIIAFITKKPHIWHIREIIAKNPNFHFFLPHKTLIRFISSSSNRIITNSKATADQFLSSESDRKVRVIYNAVDLEEFKNPQTFPNIGGLKSTDWLVAVIGKLQELKAQDDAIRAVKIAMETIPTIKLLLIGKENEKYTNYLKELVSKLNISDSVIFSGYRDDVPQILPQCKVLLMPSRYEPFGRVVIEAMAVGVPVIGTNRGGVKEIIQDGITGYLIPPKKPLKIAEKLIYLFHHPDLAKEMGNNGKEIAKEQFNIQNHTKNIEKVIQEVAINVPYEKLKDE
jgi:glycosyltransferase involved in cell wall biosynthesis